VVEAQVEVFDQRGDFEGRGGDEEQLHESGELGLVNVFGNFGFFQRLF
jgi:hypothetical protein